MEDSSSHGHLDMAIRFGGNVYLFEFMVVEMEPDGAAMAQLRARDYAAKYFVDTVAENREPFPVFLLFVGSEWMRRELASHNESVARILIPLEVPSWSRAETSDFYHRTFARAGMTVEKPGLDLMNDYAGGLPVLAHEIGDAAFRFTSRSVVSRRDAQRAVVGAVNIVGHKHFAPQVFDHIRSPRHRSPLRTIPEAAPTAPP